MFFIGTVIGVCSVVVIGSAVAYYKAKRKNEKVTDLDETKDDVERVYVNERVAEFLRINRINYDGPYEANFKEAMKHEYVTSPDPYKYFDAGIINFPDGTSLGNIMVENLNEDSNYKVALMYIQISPKKWKLIGIGMVAPTLNTFDAFYADLDRMDMSFLSEDDKIKLHAKNDKLRDPLFWLADYVCSVDLEVNNYMY